MTDTRDLFERTFALCDRQKWQHKDGSYKDASIQAKWEGWQKALETVPAPTGRHALQAEGNHPAPCATHCEAQAFKIEIRNLRAQLATPAPTAPSDVSYEIEQDGMVVAGTSGSDAFLEIMRYAVQYQQDGPIEIFKVTRTLLR